jgi:hypothetical protein
MQAICPISGVQYQITGYTPIQGTVSAPHPLLSVQTKELLSVVYPSFSEGILDSDTLHVFGIALISKLPTEGSVRIPASSNGPRYDEFWNSQIPKLIPLCRRLDGKSFKDLPTVRVTIESLPHLPYWIDELHDALNAASMPISDEARRLNREGYKNSFLNETLGLGEVPVASWSQEEKDSLVLRGIRGSMLSPKETTAFPQLIAEWADKETKFPSSALTLKDGKRTTIRTVWISIITKAVRAGSSYLDLLGGEFGIDDIQELESHLLTGLRGSSLQSKFLFEKLSEAEEVLAEFTTPAISLNIDRTESHSASSMPAGPDRIELSSDPDSRAVPAGRVLSLKEKLAIKLANVRKNK